MIKYTKKEKKAILKWLKNQICITENYLEEVGKKGFTTVNDFYRTEKYVEGLGRLEQSLSHNVKYKIPEFHCTII